MVYECKHCNGICEIEIIRETEKATEPEIEFCPFCGLSNSYPKEILRDKMSPELLKTAVAGTR